MLQTTGLVTGALGLAVTKGCPTSSLTVNCRGTQPCEAKRGTSLPMSFQRAVRPASARGHALAEQPPPFPGCEG